MEKLSDFLKDLKERFSSPLFSSFILSWSVINWKVIIGLVFYKSIDLKADGYSSYFNLISKDSTWGSYFWEPLGLAILYTFFFPVIRNCIHAFNTWIEKWGNKWNFNISKEGKVSMAKYIELKQVYEERSKLLEKNIEDASNFLVQNENLKNENLKLKEESNNKQEEIQSLKSINERLKSTHDVNLLNGDWEFKLGSAATTVINISSGFIEYVGRADLGKDQIKSFQCNERFTQLSFILIKARKNSGVITTSTTYNLYDLNILDNFKTLTGNENNQVSVTLNKRGKI